MNLSVDTLRFVLVGRRLAECLTAVLIVKPETFSFRFSPTITVLLMLLTTMLTTTDIDPSDRYCIWY